MVNKKLLEPYEREFIKILARQARRNMEKKLQGLPQKKTAN
ncbi:hypothetical protein MHB43_20505 [Paenibacillus sp. FSL H8-0317]